MKLHLKRQLKRALELLFVPIAAALVFFEDVLLHYLGVAMAALARLPWIARMEAWLARLPPPAALVAFVAPSTLVLPVKLAAFWFALNGKLALATVSIVVGKVIATALVARLYKILRPTLVTMPWFLASEACVFRWRDRLYGFVRQLQVWQRITAMVQRMRAWLSGLVAGLFAR